VGTSRGCCSCHLAERHMCDAAISMLCHGRWLCPSLLTGTSPPACTARRTAEMANHETSEEDEPCRAMGLLGLYANYIALSRPRNGPDDVSVSGSAGPVDGRSFRHTWLLMVKLPSFTCRPGQRTSGPSTDICRSAAPVAECAKGAGLLCPSHRGLRPWHMQHQRQAPAVQDDSRQHEDDAEAFCCIELKAQ